MLNQGHKSEKHIASHQMKTFEERMGNKGYDYTKDANYVCRVKTIKNEFGGMDKTKDTMGAVPQMSKHVAAMTSGVSSYRQVYSSKGTGKPHNKRGKLIRPKIVHTKVHKTYSRLVNTPIYDKTAKQYTGEFKEVMRNKTIRKNSPVAQGQKILFLPSK